MQARTDSDGSGRWRWSVVGAAGAVGLMAVFTFWPVIKFEFVHWDDDANITQNSLLTAPWAWDPVKRMFAGEQTQRFEPLHWLLFHALHDVFGLNPVAWHAANLALHTMAAILLFFVLRRTFAIVVAQADARRREFVAMAAAAWWAVHPLRAEVVGWATASAYSQAAVFLLISFNAYLRATQPVERTLSSIRAVPVPIGTWLVTSWLMAVAAYATYPVATAYPLWLLVADAWLLRPHANTLDPAFPVDARASLNRAIVFAVPAIAAMALTMWVRLANPGVPDVASSGESVGMLARVALAIGSLTYFASQLLWPGHLTPGLASVTLTTGAVVEMLGMTIVAVAATMAAWRFRRQRPGYAAIVFGALAISIPCLELSGRLAWPADRYSYLVDAILVGGVAGAILTYLARAPGRLSAAIASAAALLIVASAFVARTQAMIWRDTDTLINHVAQSSELAPVRPANSAEFR